MPFSYVAKNSNVNRLEMDGSLIDDSAGDDIETMRNENDGKSYEIESTAKSVTTATEDQVTPLSRSIDADINDDSDIHRESLCDTCENKGKHLD